MATLACAQNLKFNANGKFKIVQFTDVHYISDDPRSDIAIERINEVLNAENPDLVVFTGDVIYGKPAEKSMRSGLKFRTFHCHKRNGRHQRSICRT